MCVRVCVCLEILLGEKRGVEMDVFIPSTNIYLSVYNVLGVQNVDIEHLVPSSLNKSSTQYNYS